MNSKTSDESGIDAASSKAELDTRAARRAFDHAAGYAGGQWDLADEIARRMAERLDYVRLEPTHIVDAGCGQAPAGILVKRFPAALLTGIDSSLGMAMAARAKETLLSRFKRAMGIGSDRIVCGDLCALPIANSSVGMVWSNLALAWASDLGLAFRECHRVLKDGGLLMFSSYGPDTLRELKAAFATVDTRPHVHEFSDMHDLGDRLLVSGFSDPVMDMDKVVYTYAGVAPLVSELRRSGQTNAMLDRRRGLTSRFAWNAMSAAYSRRPDDGRIEATFEIVYGHAWKIGAKARASKSLGGAEKIKWFPERGTKS
ncbi:MAG: methyltransferase domain-containing protein [Betaproteobacteria bacterium]|nr:methyltransferase domain-containing protein [Betaproteobacteria bacterium]